VIAVVGYGFDEETLLRRDGRTVSSVAAVLVPRIVALDTEDNRLRPSDAVAARAWSP
jgi:hypothetical protein